MFGIIYATSNVWYNLCYQQWDTKYTISCCSIPGNINNDWYKFHSSYTWELYWNVLGTNYSHTWNVECYVRLRVHEDIRVIKEEEMFGTNRVTGIPGTPQGSLELTYSSRGLSEIYLRGVTHSLKLVCFFLVWVLKIFVISESSNCSVSPRLCPFSYLFYFWKSRD